jgi:hypothetical protein
VSLVEVLGPTTGELARRVEDADESLLDSIGLSLVRFMGYVHSMLTALILGARLEGLKPKAVKISVYDEDVPCARALVEFDDLIFLVHAKPFIDVRDVDEAADDATEVAEEFNGDVVVILAAYEFSYYAEKYAKSIGLELMRLGI